MSVSFSNKIGIAFSCTNPLKIIMDMLASVTKTAFVFNAWQQGIGAVAPEKVLGKQTIKLSDIYDRHKKRATVIEAVYGERLEQYFTHYSMNYWLTESYVSSENLVIHSRKLLVRIACLRFMFFCHQNIIALLEEDDISGQQDLIDRTAVEVFYQFSRMYEHNVVVIQKIEDDIIKYDFGLPVLASLIKF